MDVWLLRTFIHHNVAIAQLVDTLTSLLAPYSITNDPEHRVAQYSPHYRLAFSLLNEDAAAGNAILDWKIQDGLKGLPSYLPISQYLMERSAYVNPILHRLSPLHNFTIESQVQFHAPLAFTPRQLDQAHGLTPEDLTVFVNSAEWTLCELMLFIFHACVVTDGLYSF